MASPNSFSGPTQAKAEPVSHARDISWKSSLRKSGNHHTSRGAGTISNINSTVSIKVRGGGCSRRGCYRQAATTQSSPAQQEGKSWVWNWAGEKGMEQDEWVSSFVSIWPLAKSNPPEQVTSLYSCSIMLGRREGGLLLVCVLFFYQTTSIYHYLKTSKVK